MGYPLRYIAQPWDGKHRLADEIFKRDGRGVRRFIRVALRGELPPPGVNGDDAVRGKLQILVQHERDRVAHLHVGRGARSHVQQRAGGVGRLHAAAEHTVRRKPEQAHKRQ